MPCIRRSSGSFMTIACFLLQTCKHVHEPFLADLHMVVMCASQLVPWNVKACIAASESPTFSVMAFMPLRPLLCPGNSASGTRFAIPCNFRCNFDDQGYRHSHSHSRGHSRSHSHSHRCTLALKAAGQCLGCAAMPCMTDLVADLSRHKLKHHC